MFLALCAFVQVRARTAGRKGSGEGSGETVAEREAFAGSRLGPVETALREKHQRFAKQSPHFAQNLCFHGFIEGNPLSTVPANFRHGEFPSDHLGHQNLNLDDYLRPVDAVIVFPESNELLLLSEREADLALEAFWTAKSHRNVFTNWALWRNSFSLEISGVLPVASRPSVLQDASALVSIQAFMGDTRFKEEAQKKELQDLVNHVERECGDARAIKEFATW